MIEVSIVVPAHNAGSTLLGCLTSLVHQDFPREAFEIIVVNDASVDNTEIIARRWADRYANVTYRHRARSRNLGSKNARGRYLAFIDADCRADKDWLARLCTELEKPYLGATQGTIFENDRKRVAQNLALQISSSFLPTLASGGFLIRRDLFEQIEGFDESLDSWEDTDLTWKILETGFGVSQVSTAHLFHEPSSFTKKWARAFQKGKGKRLLLKKWKSKLSLESAILAREEMPYLLSLAQSVAERWPLRISEITASQIHSFHPRPKSRLSDALWHAHSEESLSIYRCASNEVFQFFELEKVILTELLCGRSDQEIVSLIAEKAQSSHEEVHSELLSFTKDLMGQGLVRPATSDA